MLISVEALAQNVMKPTWVVFDCRFTLGQPTKGLDAYLLGHIPGALYLDLEQDLSGPKRPHGGRHPLPEPSVLAAKLGAAGVGDETTVVVYDDGEGMVARAWWLLRYLGHDRVFVLDGGWSAWRAAGHAAATAVPRPQPRQFTVRARPDWVMDTADVARLAAGARVGVLLDARAPERFRGDVEPLDPAKGHIPGAVNRPWTANLSTDGTWKSADTLRREFDAILKQRGYDKDMPLVAYCGSGVTACANLLALALAGYHGARLYAGSWSDWCSYPEHPIATGDASTTAGSSG